MKKSTRRGTEQVGLLEREDTVNELDDVPEGAVELRDMSGAVAVDMPPAEAAESSEQLPAAAAVLPTVPALGRDGDEDDDEGGLMANGGEADVGAGGGVDDDDQQATLFHLWRSGSFMMMLYFVPVTIVLLTVLVVDWQRAKGMSDKCPPLQVWGVVQVTIQAGFVWLHGGYLFSLFNRPRRRSSLRKYVDLGVSLLARTINLALLVWLIVGIVWAFKAAAKDECHQQIPFLYAVVFNLVILQLVCFVMAILGCCCTCLMILLRVSLHNQMLGGTGLYGAASAGASPQRIGELPSFAYHPDDVVTAADATCAICLGDYENEELIRMLPCGHHFHASCIDKWLVTNKTCPFCKRDIDSPEPSPHMQQVTVETAPSGTPETQPHPEAEPQGGTATLL
eukprot:TRINITY_DN3356_c0_g1_i1.p1 TRINITY_DN3356_c0_g1~~TRINITY_DN3356_c0_g1_i1.p1  ORF type:complete len:395 (-),score=98.61 TRINITY_DN3356_c0_g1_i1:75-1259(-)